MPDDSVAIIGMAARVPGASDIAAFAANLEAGVESLTKLGDEELRAAGVSGEALSDPHYVKVAPLLADYDRFDAPFFGITPAEAAGMDPQHRVFLQLCWSALEDGGYAGRIAGTACGVFGGAGAVTASYLLNPDHFRPGLVSVNAGMGHVGNDKDFLATRVSYRLDLRGPALTVQTACSTSLVAIHLACRSLLDGECETALAGGVTVRVPHAVGYFHQPENIFSPDGHCRAFDAEARGTILGSGAGVVLLKPLAAALRDGDRVHAIIRGSAINNDGASKQSYWASSAEGIEAAVSLALERSGVHPDSIGYIETHGTGTILGDPVEIFALNRAFRRYTKRRQFCAIGSVKTNIGHLEAAAGVVSFIKAVLALRSGVLAPSLHFRNPNPHIRFERTPFYVSTKRAGFETDGASPRRAAVNSMGIGGTNAHVILEAAPVPAPETVPSASENGRSAQGRERILVVSARTTEALDDLRREYAGRLSADVSIESYQDLCYTAAVGRAHYSHRTSVVAASPAEAARLLSMPPSDSAKTKIPSLELIFASEEEDGAQVELFAQLFQEEPLVRSVVGRFDFVLREEYGGIGIEYIEAPGGDAGPMEPRIRLVVMQLAFAGLWRSLGLTPARVAFEGAGLFAATFAADMLPPDTALRLAIRSVRDPASFAVMLRDVAFAAPVCPLVWNGDHQEIESDDLIDPACWRRPERSGAPMKCRLPFIAAPAFAVDTAPASLPAIMRALYLSGFQIDWQAYLRAGGGRVTDAPLYPFRGERHWIEGEVFTPGAAKEPALPEAQPLKVQSFGTQRQAKSPPAPDPALPGSPLFDAKRANSAAGGIVFYCTGHGALWNGMARELLGRPAFAERIRECQRAFASYLPRPLLEELQADSLSDDLEIVQALIFSMHLGLDALWEAEGIKPDIYIGHSIGEISAACLAGMLSLEDAARIVHHRSRLLKKVGGRTAAIGLGRAETEAELERAGLAKELAIASENGPRLTAVSGAEEVLESFGGGLRERGVFFHPVAMGFAGHGPLCDSILPEFRSALGTVAGRPGYARMLSTVTGRFLEAGDITAEYWARNIRETVRFWPALAERIDPARSCLIEISPHPLLLSSLKQAWPAARILPSLIRGDGGGVFADSLAAVRDWRSQTESPPVKVSPLAGSVLDIADTSRRVRQVDLTTGDIDWCEQHTVAGAKILPGSAFLEMACMLGQDAFGLPTADRPLVIRDFEFQKAVSLEDGPVRRLQFSLGPREEESDSHAFLLDGKWADAGQDEDWERHAIGRIAAGAGSPGDRVALDEFLKRLDAVLPAADFYGAFADQGQVWGELFQSPEPFYRAPGEALRMIDTRRPGKDGYYIHPAVLDCCLQTLNLPGLSLAGIRPPGSLVFHNIGELRFHGPLPERVWCHARANRSASDGDLHAADLRVFDDTGRVFIEGRALTIRYMRPPEEAHRHIHTVAWQPLEKMTAGPVSTGERWLIRGDHGGVGAQLVRTLAAEGIECELLAPGESPARLNGSLSAVTRIVDLGLLDLSLATDLPARSVARSIQRLAGYLNAPSTGQARLWLATRGSWRLGNEEVVDPAQTAFWGFARSLSAEYADRWGGIVDLPADLSPVAGAEYLSRCLRVAVPRGETQFAVRDDRVNVPRLEQTGSLPGDEPKSDGARTLRPDGVYVITGGLGALGLLLARHLSRNGVRNIALLSRRSPGGTGPVRDAIDAMEAEGTRLRTFVCDVADEERLREVLGELQEDAPLRGVFHAAGIARPGVFSEVSDDPSAIEEQLRAKVDGAYWLDVLTRTVDLDCFVLFSSAAAVLPSPLLAVYAAANAYLDGLAGRRRARGLAALAVDWGRWDGGGMALDSYGYRAGSMAESTPGMPPMQPGDALRALDELLGRELPGESYCVMDVDWRRWARHHYEAAAQPFLNRLVAAHSHKRADALAEPIAGNESFASDESLPTDESISSGESGVAKDGSLVYLQEVLASALRIAPAGIDPTLGLNRIGLDSMMALHVTRRIYSDHKINLPLASLLRGSSLLELTEVFDSAIAKTNTEAAVATSGARATGDDRFAAISRRRALLENAAGILADLEELSVADADSLLRTIEPEGTR